MADQSDILSGESTPAVATQVATTTTNVETAPVAHSYDAQLKSIMNEEGLQKYASVEDALTGAAHAQEFIKTLKQEKEDALAQLQEATAQTAHVSAEPVTTEKGLGVDDVYSIYKDIEQSKVQESNRLAVKDTLLKHCNGDLAKAEEVLNSRLEKLGMTRSSLNTLATTSPSAVYELLGLGKQGQSSSYTSGTINPDAVEAHTKREVPQAKRLPIGAGTEHMVNAWRDAVAEVNDKS